MKKFLQKTAKYKCKIEEIADLIGMAKSIHEDTLKQKLLLEKIIETAGGYIWQKDINGKYVFCDPTWCQKFFKLKPGCDEHIIGKDDKELLDEYRATGLCHTFGNICTGTDAHCLQTLKKQRYIEIGWINKSIFILDVVKTPFLIDEELAGTVGFARDLSHHVQWICNEVQRLLDTGGASVVFKNADTVAAYLISEDCEYVNDFKCMTLPG